MRCNRSLHVVVLAGLLACGQTGIGTRAQAIVGGSADGSDGAIVALTIAGGTCSGVVVAPRVVITAAHCAAAGAGSAQPGSVDFGAVVPSASTADIVAIWIDRAYAGEVEHDLAALRLDRDAPIAPIAIGSDASVGDEVLAVGYGETSAHDEASRGTRRAVALAITAVAARSITAGDADATTCLGDSGGALLDATGAVIGLVSEGTDACDAATSFARPSSEPELAEVIAAWSGPCPADGTCEPACADPDPDCDPCAFDGTCTVTCPAVDLDCPVGGQPGAACIASTDCESRVCLPIPENSLDGSYCSAACAQAADCPPPLGACTGGACTFAAGTPGIPGDPCTDASGCRDGLCDVGAGVCTVACDADGRCASGQACVALAGTRACIDASGCSAGGGAGWPILAAVALLARGLARRRRAL